MLRISIPWMLDVSAALDQLGTVRAGDVLEQHFMALFHAQILLEDLFNQSVYSHYLRSSRQKGDELHAAINRVTGEDLDFSKALDERDVANMQGAKDQFGLVFRSEISTLPVFLVTRKENYDALLLIEQGSGLFPMSMLEKVPETEKDAMEVGKALAFELGTACGFHTFRVTESVLKRYWDKVSSGEKRPGLETLGNYAAEMEKRGFGDAKVIQSIKQMTKLHRNPIIHPEVILTVDEAIGIIGIARSVIGAMLAALPDVPPTTGQTSLEELF